MTTRPSTSGGASASPASASSGSARKTTSGARPGTPAPAARAARSTTTSATDVGCGKPTAPSAATAAASPRSGTWSSRSTTRTRRQSARRCPAQHRYRHGAGARHLRHAGQAHGLRDRHLRAAARSGRRNVRQDIRRSTPATDVHARRRRARARHHLPHRRRRDAFERRARLRAAPPAATRRALRPASGPQQIVCWGDARSSPSTRWGMSIPNCPSGAISSSRSSPTKRHVSAGRSTPASSCSTTS